MPSTTTSTPIRILAAVKVFELAATLYNATDPPLVNSLSYATPEYLMCNATLNGANNPTCHLLGVDPAEYIARTNAGESSMGSCVGGGVWVWGTRARSEDRDWRWIPIQPEIVAHGWLLSDRASLP